MVREATSTLLDPLPRPAVFLHIQKTAGTSVQEMARAIYGNENVISHADYKSLGVEGCRGVPFVSGHFGFSFVKALEFERYRFTFLRDPVQRLISLYRFCRSRDPNESLLYRIAQQTTLDEFLEPRYGDTHWRAVWNNQTFQLYQGYGADLVGETQLDAWNVPRVDLVAGAITNLKHFDFVGFQETFARDIRLVFDAVGAAPIGERRSNVSAGSGLVEHLPSTTQRRLRELTCLDQIVYDHAVMTYGRFIRASLIQRCRTSILVGGIKLISSAKSKRSW